MEIAYICIHTSDFEESARFYRDILELEYDLARSGDKFCALKVGSTYIGIEPEGMRKESQKTKAENPILIQFKANNIEELEKYTIRLESKGVKILDRMLERSYGVISNFNDPDGNKLEFLYQKF